MRIGLLVETLALIAAVALAFWGMGAALDGAFDQAKLDAQLRSLPALTDALAAARRDFALGALALLLGRLYSAWRAPGIAAWPILPAAVAMAAVGATL